MSELAIRQVLEGEVASLAQSLGLRVQYENQRFDDPPVNKAYLRATILWAPAVENDAVDGVLLSGILQLDIFGVPLIGAKEVGEIIEQAKEAFPLDNILDAGACKVMQRTPLRVAPPIPDSARYHVPTSFQFIAYT